VLNGALFDFFGNSGYVKFVACSTTSRQYIDPQFLRIASGCCSPLAPSPWLAAITDGGNVPFAVFQKFISKGRFASVRTSERSIGSCEAAVMQQIDAGDVVRKRRQEPFHSHSYLLGSAVLA
jgi:hypothetical protein